MTIQIIGGHNLGLLDGSASILSRNDPTGAGTLGQGVSAYANVGNGDLVYQERDAFLPSLGADFDLVRTYNSRGVYGSSEGGWRLNTAVTLEKHQDSVLGGNGSQTNYTVTYGDGSRLHFAYDATTKSWISTDGDGAYETLVQVANAKGDQPAFIVTRADQSRYAFDSNYNLLSITDPNGVAMTFAWQSGLISKVTDDSGHVITFNYTGSRLTSVTKTSTTDATPITPTTLVQYGYTNNVLTQVTDRMGRVTGYSYDSNGLLVGVSLPSKQVVNGVTQTFQARQLTFVYQDIVWDDHPHDVSNFEGGKPVALSKIIDPMGGVTSFEYGFRFAGTIAAEDRDIAYKDPGGLHFQGGTTKVVDALGNARATSNDAEYVTWRTANGYYASYGASSPQAQVDAIRNAQSVVYSYDANSQITQVVDQLGYKTTYAYDAKGNLASIVERNGYAAISRDDQTVGDGYYRKLRVDLGFADQPISWFTARPDWATTLRDRILAKFTTSFVYDTRGNQLSSTDGAGNQTSFTYTTFNKVATITSAVGNALATSDDPVAQAKRVELGYAASVSSLTTAQRDDLRTLYTTTFAYDAKQNLTQRTDPGGDVTTYVYNANGDVTSRTVTVPAAGANAAMSQVTTYTYDAYGNNVSTKDAEGYVTKRTFDSFGNMLTSVDARDNATSYVYDRDNRLLSTTTPEGRVTINAYDAAGNRIAVTDQAGKTVTQVFDKNNLLIATVDPSLPNSTAASRSTTFQYDILGNQTRSTDAEERVTTYAFDSRRLMVSVTTPQVLKADGSQGSYVTRYAYDGQGNAVTQVDNNGNTTQTLYTNTGLVRRITEATGSVTEYTYDANLQQVTVVLGAQLPVVLGAQLPVGQRRVLGFSYDEENQLVTSTDALGNKRTTTYDAVGNAVAVQDENGKTTYFQFDRDNRLVKETKPGVLDPVTGQASTYTLLHQFDGNGNEVKTTDENGAVTTFAFDRDDRKVLVTDPNGVNTVYAYDTRGNTTTIAIGVAADYDAATGKVTVTNASRGQVETFTYDEFSQLVARTDGVGNALVGSDDAVYRTMRTQLGKSALVSGLSTADKTALLAQYTDTFRYDHVGNRIGQTDHLGRVTSSVYDTLDRLQSRTDAVGVAGQERTIAYRYDGNGNRVSTVDALGRTATYTFDAADRIASTTDALGTVTRFSYDDAGNKTGETLAADTTDARTTTYTYDLGDRLTTVTDPEGHVTRYTYDAVGNRLSATTADVTARAETTQYVYDALGRNIKVIDPLGFETKYVYDGRGDQLSIVPPSGGPSMLQYDAGGRVLQSTDGAGRVTRYAYDTLGNAVAITTAYGLPEAETTTFVYDAEGHLRQMTDAAGNVATTGYDAVYNLTRETDANGATTTHAFDALNREVKITDALGNARATSNAAEYVAWRTANGYYATYDASSPQAQVDAIRNAQSVVYTYDAVDNRLTETDALGGVRTFTYDAADRQITQTDALRVQTTFAYDRVGNRTSITQAANMAGQARTTQFVYDKDDKLVGQIDPLGGETRYEYDENHNVVRVTDALGNAQAYSNDAEYVAWRTANGYYATYSASSPQAQVAAIRNAHTVAYAYDADNRVTAITDPLGGVTRYAYDASGNRTQVIDANGGRTTFYYNGAGEVVRTIDALGYVTARSLDGNGNVVSQTLYANAVAVPTDPSLPAPTVAPNAAGDRTTAYAYDLLNRLVRQTSPEGGVRSFGYDAVGNKTSETDPNNHATTYAYDLLGRLTTETDALGGVRTSAYDAVGNKTSETDALGRVTRYAYDLENRVLTVTDALNGMRSFTYDAVGNKTGETDALNRLTAFEYDADNRLVRQTDALGGVQRFAYDAVGNRTQTTDELNRVTLSVYDAGDRRISRTDALGGVHRYAYDAAGNLVRETDENGHATVYTYDLDNRLTGQTDPLGGTRSFSYDAAGNQLAAIDPNGHTTAFAYDRDDRLIARTDALSGIRRFTYDAAGNKTVETDENGHATTFAYDALDRLASQTDALGGVRSYAYDAVGNKIGQTDENGHATTFAYDALDRLTSQTDALGGVRSYAYDAAGNRLTETDERGKTNRFTYDALDRLTRQTDALGAIRQFAYDAVGNKTSETDEKGLTTRYAYDANDRLTGQSDPLGHTRALAYDAVGNVTSQTDENGRTVTFTYDANDRLTRQTDLIGSTAYVYDAVGNTTSVTDANGNATAFVYDANDRLTQQTDQLGGIKRYGYDAVGNRTSETDENGHAVTYSHDAADRVVGIVDGEGYRTTLEYDAAGNLLRRTQQLSLTDATKTAVTVENYDALNHVVSTLTAGGRLIGYAYDAAGNLVSKTEYDQRYALAGGTTLLRTFAAAAGPTVPAPAAGDAGRVTRMEYDDGGRLVATVTPLGIRTEYGYDAVGNRTSEITAAGTPQAITSRITYDSAGRVTDTADALGTVTHYVLDAHGNVLERHDAYGTAVERTTYYTYDGNDRVIRETDALGIVTTFAYDSAGNMMSRTRAGRTESFEYDANHRLRAETNGAGERTEYAYDGAGNQTQIRVGVVGSTAVRTVSSVYDGNDKLVAEVDGNGVRTEYRYDGAGNRIETIQNAGAAAADQRHTLFAYDSDNRLTSVTSAEGGVTSYEYDALGNQTRIVGPTGSVTTNTFDGNGRITVNVVGANGPHGGVKTANVYDQHGNVVQTTVSFGDGTDARITAYGYDALDRQTSITDAEGFTTRFDYDAFGNQTGITTGLYLPQSGDAGYDAAKAARAHASRTVLTYDALDRLTDTRQTTDSASGAGDTLHATYDAFGNRLTQTTGWGTADARTVSFAYDGADRLVRRDTPAGGVVTLTYDAAGNQTAKHVLQSGAEGTAGAVWSDQTFEYDGNGRVTAENATLDGSTTVRTVHRFDAFGNEVETVEAQGSTAERTTRFEYNRNNDLVARTDAYGSAEARRTVYGVDLAGNTVKETDALGRVTRFYFDPAGRHVGTLDPEGYYTALLPDSQGNVVQSVVYMHRYADATPGQYDLVAPTPDAGEDPRTIVNSYDGVNNLVRQVLADGTRTDYRYDANRKLTLQTAYGSTDAARVARTADPAARTLAFTYDDASRLKTFVNADGSVESYAYDSANNKVSESIANPVALPGGATDPTRTTTFQYDGDNRLIQQVFDPSGLNQVETLAYDKAGNVITKTDALRRATTSAYDRLNRIVSVSDQAGNVTRFGYDLVGNQTSITDARNLTTNLVYDHLGQVVEQRLPAVDVYTLDGGARTSVRPTTHTVYDAVGNVEQETDANGQTTTRWYDGNDNVVAELSADEVLRTATFDATGAPLTTTLYMTRLSEADQNSAVLPGTPAGDKRTTAFEYDKGKRVTRTVFPTIDVTTVSNTNTNATATTVTGTDLTGTTSQATPESRSYYDAFGNLVESVDQNGNHSYGYYDTLGRQTATVDAGGYLVETSYDDQGNVVRQSKYATALDLSGVSAGTRPTAPATGTVAVVDRTYDTANRLVTETSPLTQLTPSQTTLPDSQDRVLTRYTYDAAGQLKTRTLADGTTQAQTEYHYFDAAGREVAVVNAARTLHTFEYDADGNKTLQKRWFNAVPGSVDLATATLAQVLGSVSADTTHDEATTLVYDALNRLVSQTQNVENAGGGSTDLTLSTAYDLVGNATQRTDADGYVTRIAYDALGHATRTVTPDGTTSFIEYNAAGEKVRAWTGVIAAGAAQPATGITASIGSDLRLAWSQPGTNLRSYVVYDTASHADASFAGGFPSAVYAGASAYGGTGSVSVALDLARFSAGQTVYFRVVTLDSAGGQVWTQERSLVVPARMVSVSTARSGGNLVVTVAFNGAVSSPQVLSGSGGSLGTTTGPAGSSGNTYTFNVPAGANPQSLSFAVRWTYGGTVYTSSATPFESPTPHTATGSELHWALPTALASQQTVPDQVILVNGVRLDGGYTFAGEIHFDPTPLLANGTQTYAYDVLYGNANADTHTAGVSYRELQNQVATVNHYVTHQDNGNTVYDSTVWDLKWVNAGVYATVGTTLSATEVGQVGTGGVHVAWRAAGSGTAFGSSNDVQLTKNGSVYGTTAATDLNLSPGTSYDLKIYYVDSSGREVIVEWRRVTTPAEAANNVANGQTSTTGKDVAPAAASRSVSLGSTTFAAGRSVTVLARETDGSFGATRPAGANPAVTIGTIVKGLYVGPLDAAANAFSLNVGTTAGTLGGQKASDGLASQTYFTEIEYNALGVKIASNEDDGLWRRYGVDASGNRVETLLYGTKADETAHLATSGDTAHAPIVTFAAFDARNLEIARFGAAVTVAGSATPQRGVTRMTYDYAGRLASQLDPTPGAQTRRFAYDAAGNRISETDAAGQTTSYAYDRLGHVVLVTDPLGHTRRRVYDSAGRMTQEQDGNGNATSFVYDAFDRAVTRTDPSGHVTRYAYDRRDRLTRLTDALSHDTTYAYDGRDDRVSVVDVNGNTTAQAFDAMGRVVATTTSSAIVSGGALQTSVQTYRYDAYGNRISETDAEGRTRYMTYGAFGRLLEVSDEGGRVTRFAYDRFGRTVGETSEASGKNVARTYNDAGWLLSVSDTGTNTTRQQTTYTYDIAGQRKTETVVWRVLISQTVRDIAYSYDGAGRLTRWADATTGLNLNYSWDAAGNQSRVYNDSLSTNHYYAFDANNQVTSASQGTTVLGSYTYDAAGNRTRLTAGSSVSNYAYDALGRVTRTTDASGHTRATWTYDNLGNVTEYKEYQADGTTLVRQITSTYFENGLVKSSRTYVPNDVSDDDKKRDQTTTSEYDKSRRLVKQTLVDSTDGTKTYTYTFTYTADGRTTKVSASGPKDASGNSVSTYDADDRLIRLDKGKGDGDDADSAEFLTFGYDNDGHIVRRFHDDGNDDTTNPTTRFVYANGNPVGETGTNKSNATVTLLDANGKSGDGEVMQYNPLIDIGAESPESSASTYTARLGDSLQAVAAAVYGNPSLWYLIADANGLTGSETLKAGQVLQVPTTVQTGRINADTHVLYKESDIVGSKLPNLKTPDSGNKCGLIGAIILIVVVAIAAVVLTIVTAGIAAPAAVAALGLTAGTVGAIVTTVAVTAVIGAVVGFAASVATQGILVGFGLQESFDWKQVAADVVAGFVSGAVAGLGEAIQVVKLGTTMAKVANVAAQAALEAAGETARQAIANDGRIDNPWSILIAAGGGAFGAVASRAVRTESQLSGKVTGIFKRDIVEVAPAAGKAGKLLGKTKRVVTVADKELLAQVGEGASVYKSATTKLVKGFDENGNVVLKQVERTAFASKEPRTILKLKDTKLVKIGDEVVEMPRISATFSRTQRVGRRLSGIATSTADAVKSIPGKVAGYADTALQAVRSVPGKISGAFGTAAEAIRAVGGRVVTAGRTAFAKASDFVGSAVAAVRTLPDKAARALDDARTVARLVGRTVVNGIDDVRQAAGVAVRAVGRTLSELPGRIARGAAEAWGVASTAARSAKNELFDFVRSASDAVKSLGGRLRAGAGDLAQSFREFRQSGTVAKGDVTKTVRYFEDSPTGRIAKYRTVLRESFTKKGYKTLLKDDASPLLERGTKLVRVGDEVQTWRRVSSQYTTSQRISRYFAKKPLLNRLAGDEFKVDKTLFKVGDTKVVRTGFERRLNPLTQQYEEVATYAVKRRLSADGLDKTSRFIRAVKAAPGAAVAGLGALGRGALTAGRTAVGALATAFATAAGAVATAGAATIRAASRAASATADALSTAASAAADALSAAASAAGQAARSVGRSISTAAGKAYQAAADGVFAARRFLATDAKLYAELVGLKLKDAIGNANPFTKWKMVSLLGNVAFRVGKGQSRDYDNDRAGGPVATLKYVGKNTLLTVLKRPLESLNNSLLHDEQQGVSTNDEDGSLFIRSLRGGLSSAQKAHGWWPADWVSTSAGATSRVLSPIDLDYNASREQQLRGSQLGAGQTARFGADSVFGFESQLDGRVVDQTIPFALLGHLPPRPSAGAA